ncbi:hypothetical protein ACWEKM_41405 [Streptomyces sp. NPDC004752]
MRITRAPSRASSPMVVGGRRTGRAGSAGGGPRERKLSVKGQDVKTPIRQEDIAGYCDLGSVRSDAQDAQDAEDTDSDATGRKTSGVDGGSVKDAVRLTFSAHDQPVPAQKPAGPVLDLDAPGG